MKKKIYLVFTFIVSLFICCGSVDAARKMQCLYEGNAFNVCKILIQDGNGKLSIYINTDGSCKIDDSDFSPTDDYTLNFDETTVYDSEKGELTECPKYTSGTPWGKGTVHFYDKDGKFELIDHIYDEDLDTSNYYLEFSSNTDYSEQVENTDWLGECVYSQSSSGSKLYLYFNSNDLIIVNKRNTILFSRTKFTLNELNDLNQNACPPRLYEMYYDDLTSIYDDNNRTAEYYIAKPVEFYTNVVVNTLYPLDESKWNGGDGGSDDGNKTSIENCDDLLGPELIGIINKVMGVFRIAVPILLIVFGIIDFTKVIFSGKEDEMATSRNKFIKRIIAAVIVFLIPIFVNLILTIANEVWDYINPNTCIK